MFRKRWLSVALAACLGGTATAQAQDYLGRTKDPRAAPQVNLWNNSAPAFPATPDSEDVYVIPPEKETAASDIIQVQATTAPVVVPPRVMPMKSSGDGITWSWPRTANSGNGVRYVQAPQDTTQPGTERGPGERSAPAVTSPMPGEGTEQNPGSPATPVRKVRTLQNWLKKLCGKEVSPNCPEKK
jgi:hypothetical protein